MIIDSARGGQVLIIGRGKKRVVLISVKGIMSLRADGDPGNIKAEDRRLKAQGWRLAYAAKLLTQNR